MKCFDQNQSQSKPQPDKVISEEEDNSEIIDHMKSDGCANDCQLFPANFKRHALCEKI